uniref:HAT C-terminal dimerisation domain-containing protein n=1 Tax=Ditylenchus dipsaci TaxID=166011 RepID=A0A915DUX1_9BILA
MDRVNFDPIFFVACALDPTTAGCLDDSDLAKCADWIRQMLPEDRRTIIQPVVGDANNTLDNFISRLKKDAQSSRRSTEAKGSRSKSWILNALHSVQDVGNGGNDVDAVKYWSGFLSSDWHALAVLALQVLIVPATSAPIERIFSQAGLATRGLRNRTNVSLLNSQLIIYCNGTVI